MKRVSSETNLFADLPIIRDLDNVIKKSKKNVILFGTVGSGKTFLLNKLCGTNYLTAEEGFSCTRVVQHDFSQIHDMIIIDFPGLKASEDIIGHLSIQKKALSVIPVRMICFVIEYSQRFDTIIREVKELISIFKKNLNNITIIITKSEDVKDDTKEKIKFQIKSKFKIENVLFTEKKTNGLKLCDELETIKIKMDYIENMEIKTKDLIKTVLVSENDHFEMEREKYKKEFDESIKLFNNELNKTNDSELKKAIFFCLRDYKTTFLEKYSNELRNKKIDGVEIDMDSVITEILLLDNEVSIMYENFRKNVEKSLEIKINNYNNEFNRFKKCPHCGTIWFKIKGCDSIVCGKRTTLRDKFFGRFKKYIVSFINNIINIKIDDLGNENKDDDSEFVGLTEAEKAENLKRAIDNKIPIKAVGCGNNLKWSEMEDVSEKIIKKLKENIFDEDYYSGFLDISHKLNNEKKKNQYIKKT